jgi:hypothetical protein
VQADKGSCQEDVQGFERGSGANAWARGSWGLPESPKFSCDSGGEAWSDSCSLAVVLDRGQRGNGEELEDYL